MENRQRRNRRQFIEEFKRDAVELVRTTGRPIAEIAREMWRYQPGQGAAAMSRQGQAGAVEVPERARVPHDDDQGDEQAARERQRPAWQPTAPYDEHLGRERAVEE